MNAGALRKSVAANGWLTIALALLAVGATAFVLISARRISYFFGDDYLGFYQAQRLPFLKALLVPIGSQIVPLHRLVNWLEYRIAPMSFDAALAILLAGHALALVYLFRTLQLIKPSRLNLVLVAWYCGYIYLWHALAWWSSGLQRIPFVALALMAIYYYLRLAQHGSARRALVVCACFLGATGFYAKAAVLPVCMLALDWILNRSTSASLSNPAFRRRLLLCGALLIVGVAYVPLARALTGSTLKEGLGNLDPLFQLRLQALSFVMLAHSAFGITLPYQIHVQRFDVEVLRFYWQIGAAWIAFIAYTIWRNPRIAYTWLAMVVVFALNFLIVGLSNRTRLFGIFVAFEPRYYYELAFLLALFVAVIIRQLPVALPERRWFIEPRRKHLTSGLLLLAVGVHAVVACFQARTTFAAAGRGPQMRQTRTYMHTLQADLEQFRRASEPPAFVDGVVPVFVNGYDFTFRFHSQLFDVLDVDARFVPREQAVFMVNEAGHVVRTRP